MESLEGSCRIGDQASSWGMVWEVRLPAQGFLARDGSWCCLRCPWIHFQRDFPHMVMGRLRLQAEHQPVPCHTSYYPFKDGCWDLSLGWPVRWKRLIERVFCSGHFYLGPVTSSFNPGRQPELPPRPGFHRVWEISCPHKSPSLSLLNSSCQ